VLSDQETPYPKRHKHNGRHEVCLLDGAPPHFLHHVCAFVGKEFPDCWIGGRDPFHGPLFSRFDSWILSSGVL